MDSCRLLCYQYTAFVPRRVCPDPCTYLTSTSGAACRGRRHWVWKLRRPSRARTQARSTAQVRPAAAGGAVQQASGVLADKLRCLVAVCLYLTSTSVGA